MASSLSSNIFDSYRTNLTRVIFSYRHLVDNLVLDEQLIELFYQRQILNLKEYRSFLKLGAKKPHEDVASSFLNLLLTKMRRRGEWFREPHSERRLEQGRSYIDYYETFMMVLRELGPGVNFIPTYMETKITFEQSFVDKLFDEILPKCTSTKYLREEIDWEAAACCLERYLNNLEESQSIIQGFVEETALLNDATDLGLDSTANASAASYASSPVDVDRAASDYDSEEHASYRGRHFERPTNEAVESDGPREMLLDHADISSSAAAFNETEENKKKMIIAMRKLGDWVDSNAPRDILNEYESETKDMQALFNLPDAEAVRRIEERFEEVYPINPNATPFQTFFRLVKLLYFLLKCSRWAPPGISGIERMMRWFLLIMKERLLSYLGDINWSALWDKVSSTVAKVLDPSRDRSARLQILNEALAEGASKKNSLRSVADRVVGVACVLAVVCNPSAALDWRTQAK